MVGEIDIQLSNLYRKVEDENISLNSILDEFNRILIEISKKMKLKDSFSETTVLENLLDLKSNVINNFNNSSGKFYKCHIKTYLISTKYINNNLIDNYIYFNRNLIADYIKESFSIIDVILNTNLVTVNIQKNIGSKFSLPIMEIEKCYLIDSFDNHIKFERNSSWLIKSYMCYHLRKIIELYYLEALNLTIEDFIYEDGSTNKELKTIFELALDKRLIEIKDSHIIKQFYRFSSLFIHSKDIPNISLIIFIHYYLTKHYIEVQYTDTNFIGEIRLLNYNCPCKDSLKKFVTEEIEKSK